MSRFPTTTAPARCAGLLGLMMLLVGCGGAQRSLTGVPMPDTSAAHAEVAPELIGVWYTVQAGDSVNAIARRHDIPVADLIGANGLAQPDRLEVGQPLFLYGVETLIKRKAAERVRKAAAPGRKAPAKPRKKGKRPRFTWPVDGARLTSGYGKRSGRPHRGIDLAAKPGTPVLAAAAGVVIYSDNKQRGYGNLVILQHDGGFVTVYAHNRRNLVDEGDRVRQGQRIAEVGSTGRSTGPHLHFEIRVRGAARDPLIFLPAR